MLTKIQTEGDPAVLLRECENMKRMPSGVLIQALFISYKAITRENRPSGKLINRCMTLTHAWGTLGRADAKVNTLRRMLFKKQNCCMDRSLQKFSLLLSSL